MALTHEIPTHLSVEDTIIFGLTSRQVLTFMAFASPAYGLWEQAGDLALVLRGALALGLALLGLVFTLVRPAGRPLDEWLFALVAYLLQPRRMTWRRTPDQVGDPAAAGWAELSPDLGWAPVPFASGRQS
jgi:hypothetical protein